jgi:hypothetical protein
MEDEELIGEITIGYNNDYWTVTGYPDDRVLVYNSNTTSGDYTISKAPEAPIVEWAPKEDITPYEMALCAPILIYSGTGILTIAGLGEMIKDMSPKALRHFRIEDPNFKGAEWDVIK